MRNQSLKSLALISDTALDVLAQLASAHMFALCQALDLRDMRLKVLEYLKPRLMDDIE